MSTLSRNFLNLGFVACALGLLAGHQVFAQSPLASSECKCERPFRTSPDSLDQALLVYTSALAKGDRAIISKYSARFTIGLHRRRIYRPHAEQEKVIDEMIARSIRSFHFCGHFTSTAELSYPPSQRHHQLAGCIRYDDGDRQRVADITVLGYRERGQWVFNPIMVPADPFPIPLSESKRIIVPVESLPPPMLPNKGMQRTRN